MKVSFWGVRGSIPSSSPDNVRYGSNTSCVSIKIGNKILILDAGTGIYQLGRKLAHNNYALFLFLSHYHWDHIQGLPLFSPFYQDNRKISVFSQKEPSFDSILRGMVDGIHFPLSYSRILSPPNIIKDVIDPSLRELGVDIETLPVNHPGGAMAFKIKYDQKILVYCTDNELIPPDVPETSYESFVSFFEGANVLVHDAHFTKEELADHMGWGHSSVSQALEVSFAAHVKKLVLFHHSPFRTDLMLDQLVNNANRVIQSKGSELRCIAARDGLSLPI